MPKRRAIYKLSSENDFKKSRNGSAAANDAVLEVLRDAADAEEDSSGDELTLQEMSSPELEFGVGQQHDGRLLQRGKAADPDSAQSFSSSLDAALRRAAVLERRAAREEREEEAMRAAAAVLKAEEDADLVDTVEEDAEAEAMAVAAAHEAARAGRRAGGGRRLSELDVAEMMADGRLGGDHLSRRSSNDFAPALDVVPCPIYDVDVRLRKYVRTDGRQLSHTPVAMAARQNRQKRKEYVKKMEIAYANMQFETQYLRERMSRLQQELKWYKDRWAEHATKCPLLHVGPPRRKVIVPAAAAMAAATAALNLKAESGVSDGILSSQVQVVK